MSKNKKDRKEKNKAKLSLRRSKLKKERTKENKKKAPCNRYPNGRAINQMMSDQNLSGSFKDYIVISGDSMLDYKNTYSFTFKGKGLKFGDEEMRIIHKKNLHKITGKSIAEQFWHPTFGRLIDVKEGTKPKQEND